MATSEPSWHAQLALGEAIVQEYVFVIIITSMVQFFFNIIMCILSYHIGLIGDEIETEGKDGA